MARTKIDSDLFVNGTISARNFTPPDSCITDASVDTAANINYSKLQGFHALHSKTAPATAVTAYSEYMHCCRSTGTIVAVEALVDVVATGTDRIVTVDVLKSTGAGAFATVLSATVDFDDSSTAKTVSAGTISDDDVVEGDILKITVTVAGSNLVQAQGLLVTVWVAESSV